MWLTFYEEDAVRIAVFSDSHDQIAHLEAALAAARAAGAEMLLHCGDLCAPFMLDRLGKGFGGPIHVVFGNNDGDGRLLQAIAAKHSHLTLHGIYAELNAGDRAVAMIHYPEPARRIAQSGQFALVCYGHNHQKHAETVGDTWLANPGELLGMQGPPTWGLYDTATHDFALHPLEP
jgi:putative phosphoesterase